MSLRLAVGRGRGVWASVSSLSSCWWLSTGRARGYSSVPLVDDAELDSEVDGGAFRDTFRAGDVVMRSAAAARGNMEALLDRLRTENGGSLGFGVFYSDHMLTVSYDGSKGWSRPVIGGLEAVRMHPAAQVLHYGMSCFEGMKVYRDLSGTSSGVLFFRPEMNLARFVNSARRLHLPSSFCTSELFDLLKVLVRKDAGWVPARRGEALYLRPVLYSSTGMLGVSPPEAATLNVIMSPSGDYFGAKGGLDGVEKDVGRGIRLFVEEGYRRAWVGGAGDVKVGGNYAPTIYPQWMARQSYGVDQVVYTREGEIEECGAMNIFFVFEGEGGRVELATPTLGHGTILPGVTRASILEIARVWAERGAPLVVSERGIGVEEVVSMARRGRLREVFACGTASVIQPVNGLVRRVGEGVEDVVEVTPRDASFAKESLTRQLYDALVDIQHGLSDDPRFADWTVSAESLNE